MGSCISIHFYIMMIHRYDVYLYHYIMLRYTHICQKYYTYTCYASQWIIRRSIFCHKIWIKTKRNKTQYLRLWLYDSDFNALIDLWPRKMKIDCSRQLCPARRDGQTLWHLELLSEPKSTKNYQKVPKSTKKYQKVPVVGQY